MQVRRVIQAAIALAILGTIINLYPVHKLYPVPILMYAPLAALMYLVIVGVAALAANRNRLTTPFIRKLVFFSVVPPAAVIVCFRRKWFLLLEGRWV